MLVFTTSSFQNGMDISLRCEYTSPFRPNIVPLAEWEAPGLYKAATEKDMIATPGRNRRS